MELSSLTAISPVDGRYRSKCVQLSDYFSEFALIRYRIKVEIEYFIALAEKGISQLKGVNLDKIGELRKIYLNFTVADARRVKEIEAITNHDVKAVEYFIKEQLDPAATTMLDPSVAALYNPYRESIHFGLTSQDINNTAVPMSISDALKDVVMPCIMRLYDKLDEMSGQWSDVSMLARTHGQPASPTRLGKEMRVFAYRLKQQVDASALCEPLSGKFGGATGNFNAHHVAYPDIDWAAFANDFLANRLGIRREEFTTQISNYDNLAEIFDNLRRVNTVILDLDRDIWMYVSSNYFKQRIKEGEVGSSAMPHKVNPIDFENSEGNIGIANALLSHLAQKLPVSRLQRDLTDSTVLRNVGVPLAHMVIAIESTLKGLDKLLLNRDAIDADLDANWPVVAEGIQTILRREGYPNPYEALKKLTRTNKHIGPEEIAAFIDSLEVSDAIKSELRSITPHSYTGM